MTGAASARTRVPQSQRSVSVYDGSAERMADLYELTSFDQVHVDILDLLPEPGTAVLDIGAGSGRDAAALADRGYLVTAVEPSAGLRREAAVRHPTASVQWIDDALPKLSRLPGRAFAFILVSAVWMHLAPRDRTPAIRRLTQLLDPGRHLAISIRIGPADPARSIRQVDIQALEADARAAGLKPVRSLESGDALGRATVRWRTLVFRAPGQA
ncbi:class I SAM-dependent methyltransferase [Sphingomonas rubra]|uniref:Methyltransferase domain-containing protein n=1 Tax=Sphingomonas rubra TaxID=634430 RepID=A0A1I5TAB1_9SPHN|nr:class I SAM-dependent methyltransferase [Sphingomonas rubra]SFP79975.1 Methyltransferase domain-containing protein [Sphingomonas rubra]